ncbi:DUF5004 domain-containing protein [Flavobacterium sp. CBA20B-1]|uniref:DUF5004 domain-containing protein n=1 Tax=unclassified Flavobacterium TaxID=196869 RepID=UPI0022242DD6|nr:MULTISPECIES: DUF5004 domain-containing protein [unclassified Flavobacterium]WCM42978.1 DUF5004 domain-containing protein [Flavobacterium sp. CBA20B-1]
MKKLVFFSALLSLVSCKDDDNTTTPVTPEAKLEGKWNLVKSETYEDGTLTDTEDLKSEPCDYDYYDLKVGGTKDEVYHNPTEDCSTENWPGTWSYNESNKYVTLIDSDDDYTIVFQVISLTTTDLKVKMISDDGDTPPQGTEIYAYLKR